MTFSETAVTDVVVDTSGETASYGAAAADQLKEQLLAAGSAKFDGVSGSTITSEAVMKAAKSCFAQAMGETVVTSVQLPPAMRDNWLGTDPTSTRTPSPRPGTPTSSSWAPTATAACVPPPLPLRTA